MTAKVVDLFSAQPRRNNADAHVSACAAQCILATEALNEVTGDHYAATVTRPKAALRIWIACAVIATVLWLCTYGSGGFMYAGVILVSCLVPSAVLVRLYRREAPARSLQPIWDCLNIAIVTERSTRVPTRLASAKVAYDYEEVRRDLLNIIRLTIPVVGFTKWTDPEADSVRQIFTEAI